jgi:regulator of protease activity HflC (stomatin/prohibitin superfamily)
MTIESKDLPLFAEIIKIESSEETSKKDEKTAADRNIETGVFHDCRNSEETCKQDEKTAPTRMRWNMGRFKSKKMTRYAVIFLVLAVVATVIGLLASSFRKLGSTQYGLEYNVHKKQLADAATAGGLHAGPPGFYFIKFPSTQVTVDGWGICNSSDGLQVAYEVTYQYQMPQEWLKDAILKYRDFDRWATVVESAGTAAVQHACADYTITNFQNQRGIIQGTMEVKLRDKLEGPERDGVGGVYARAISLQLRDVSLPREYSNAVSEKQEAAQDIQLAINQRTQETTKAQTKLLNAKQQAKKTLDTATNEATVTLTEATLKAEETQFEFETEAAVLSRVKSDLNLTTEGLLAFLSNQLIEIASEVTVSAGEPASMSRKDDL